MQPSEVTLSDWAQRLCDRFHISQNDLKEARAGSTSCFESPEWLICYGDLPGGERRVRMSCPHHIPKHIVSFRPVERE